MFSARGIPLEIPALCFWKFFNWLTDGLRLGFPCGNGNPLQCSCLENSMGSGVWWTIGISSILLKIQERGGGNNPIPFWSKTLVLLLLFLPILDQPRGMALSTAPGACKHFHMLFSCSVVSDSLRPHRPARFLCPWNSPGKNTGVGCHFLLQGIFLTQG